MTDPTPAPSPGTEIPVETPQVPPVETPQVPPVEAQQTPQDPNVAPLPEGEQPQAVERAVPAADGYKFEEGSQASQMGEIFNSLDMTQEQADGVIKLDQVRAEASATALRTAGEAHIKNWGDLAETNINLAKRGMNHFDPTGQLKEVLNETGFGNDPRLLELFFQFGSRMEEGGFLPSNVNTPGTQPKDVAHMWYPDDAPGGKNNNGYNS